jgi:hypothetical protein
VLKHGWKKKRVQRGKRKAVEAPFGSDRFPTFYRVLRPRAALGSLLSVALSSAKWQPTAKQNPNKKAKKKTKCSIDHTTHSTKRAAQEATKAFDPSRGSIIAELASNGLESALMNAQPYSQQIIRALSSQFEKLVTEHWFEIWGFRTGTEAVKATVTISIQPNGAKDFKLNSRLAFGIRLKHELKENLVLIEQ